MTHTDSFIGSQYGSFMAYGSQGSNEESLVL